MFILTWSLAVVWVDDEDTDDEELQASPHNFPQQWVAGGACTEHGIDWQGDGCPHYEHEPGGGGKHKGGSHWDKKEVKMS